MRHYSAALFYLFAAILPAAALAGPDVPGTKKEPIAQGIQRICVEGPGHKWTCDGIEVDLNDPLVAIETIPAERLAGRRETVSQIASLRERSGRSVIAVAGCDDPDENGLPDGLLIENSDLGSAPNEHPSFILTANGRAMIGRFLLSATAELQSGTTFPIKRFNRTPKPGESALLSYRFGPLPDLPGMVSIPLDIYYPFLDPNGRTLFQVGLKAETEDGIPFYSMETVPRVLRSKTYRLMLPLSLYEPYRLWLQTGLPVRVKMGLDSPDFHPRIMSSLSREPGSLHDPIVWAISGGVGLMARGKKVLGSLPAEGTYWRRVSVLGIDGTGGKLWIAVVSAPRDGTVTLSDATDCLELLGAGDGIVLASGDYSPLWIRGKVLNPPLSQSLEVPLADALVVYTLAPEPGLGRITVEPDDVLIVPPSTEIAFKVKAFDSFGQSLPLPGEAIVAEILEGQGRMEGLKYIAPKKPEDSLLRFHVSGDFGKHYSEKFIYTAVYVREPARIVVSPSYVLLEPGQSTVFRATVLDRQEEPIRVDGKRIHWNLDGGFGVMSPGGELLTRSGGSGKVSAGFGKLSAEAEVHVGKVTSVPLFWSEEIGKWKVEAEPRAGSEGDVALLESGDVPGYEVTYNFGRSEKGGVKILRPASLEGKPYGLRLSIRGDGSLNSIRCLIRDKKQRLFALPVPEAERRNTEWREEIVPFTKAYLLEGNRRMKMAFPVTFEGLLISRSAISGAVKGTFGLGRMEVLYLDME